MQKRTAIQNNMTIRDKANCVIANLTLPAITESDRQSMISRIGRMYGGKDAEIIYNEIRSLAPDQFPPEQVSMF